MKLIRFIFLLKNQHSIIDHIPQIENGYTQNVSRKKMADLGNFLCLNVSTMNDDQTNLLRNIGSRAYITSLTDSIRQLICQHH